MAVATLVSAPRGFAMGGDAPSWMHTAATQPLPEHDEKTEAVLLYSQKTVTVISTEKIKVQVRRAYKILRPGSDYGYVIVPLNRETRVNGLRAWCIPSQGKDYEVKDKDGLEVSLPKVQGGELISDLKAKVLQIPAADPGNVVGYEYQLEEEPLALQDSWEFQQEIPVSQAHYSLQLPAGWEYRAFWINFPEAKPQQVNGDLQWDISDVKAIRAEKKMPALEGVAGQLIVSFFPSGHAVPNAFDTWQQMGAWYSTLTEGRRDVSPDIQQKSIALTSSAPTAVDRAKLIAQFVQHDVRYVAIELGIGGYQPHPAAEVFAHRYGDCKDKVTLMSAMLHAVGVDSYYVLINVARGAVNPAMPAHVSGFNHAIIAIRLPENTTDPSLIAKINDPKLGKLLFFDPTNDLVPLGRIGGYLQANYGLLIGPSGGDLVKLPDEPPALNGTQRTAKLVMDPTGALKGEVQEVHVGDSASSQRDALLSSANSSDKLRPIEHVLGASIPDYHITKAQITNIQQTEEAFTYSYTFEAAHYAKQAGNLLLVRPRVMGIESSSLLETQEPRRFPVEFEAARRDTDVFEITLPAGFQADELPAAVDLDLSFASYHSKSELVGNTIRYSRTFEIKNPSVPLSQVGELKKFYRVIANDERNMAVLKSK